MNSFKGFWRWYNLRDLCPTLEAKLISHHHDQGIVLFRPLPSPADFCQHILTDPMYYSFTEGD